MSVLLKITYAFSALPPLRMCLGHAYWYCMEPMQLEALGISARGAIIYVQTMLFAVQLHVALFSVHNASINAKTKSHAHQESL